MPTLRVQVWSDIVCPWCYVGKRRLEAAIARMAAPRDIEVVWRAFELDPAAPRVQPPGRSYAERLARKYGATVEQAHAMIERMTSVAAADGLTFRFDQVRPGNTFDAHRVLHLARERGVQGAVKERLLRAYMTEGEPIGDPEALARLSVEAGLDRDEVQRVLASDTYADVVREDEAQARRHDIRAVPFFLLGDVVGVSGAQPIEVLHQALTKAMEESQQRAIPQGAVCGPEGCG
jgi:predicted DsbA family dithiol-disulfide isomerase